MSHRSLSILCTTLLLAGGALATPKPLPSCSRIAATHV